MSKANLITAVESAMTYNLGYKAARLMVNGFHAGYIDAPRALIHLTAVPDPQNDVGYASVGTLWTFLGLTWDSSTPPAVGPAVCYSINMNGYPGDPSLCTPVAVPEDWNPLVINVDWDPLAAGVTEIFPFFDNCPQSTTLAMQAVSAAIDTFADSATGALASINDQLVLDKESLALQVNQLSLQIQTMTMGSDFLTGLTLFTPMLRARQSYQGWAWIQTPIALIAIPRSGSSEIAPSLPTAVTDSLPPPAPFGDTWLWSTVTSMSSAALIQLGGELANRSWLMPTDENSEEPPFDYLSTAELDLFFPNREVRIVELMTTQTSGSPAAVLELIGRSGPFCTLAHLAFRITSDGTGPQQGPLTDLVGTLLDVVVTPTAVFIRPSRSPNWPARDEVAWSMALNDLMIDLATARDMQAVMIEGTCRIAPFNLPLTGLPFDWDNEYTDVIPRPLDIETWTAGAVWAELKELAFHAVLVFEGLTYGFAWTLVRTMWWPQATPAMSVAPRNDAQMLLLGAAMGAVTGYRAAVRGR